jgi:diaminobutyrate-2-oxoglutarate transaminase
MLGAEIVDPHAVPDGRGVLPPAPGLARRIQGLCCDNGLLVEVGGSHANVVRFLPPLVIEADDADRAVEIFGSAVAEAERDWRPGGEERGEQW